MKKSNTIGNYNITAAKTAMKHNNMRIFCHVAADGKIYVTNGGILFTLYPAEYDAIIRPLVLCDAGDWVLSSVDKSDCDNSKFAELFKNTADFCAKLEPLTKSPLMMPTKDEKHMAVFYYNSEQFACFSVEFINAFVDFDIRYAGTKGGAVVYRQNGEPFAIAMPLRLTVNAPAAERAVRAFIAPADTDTQNAIAAAVKKAERDADRKLDFVRTTFTGELAQKDARIAELEKALATAQNAAAQNAPAQIAPTEKPDYKTAAEEIAAKWATVAGLDVTVKGAQTAAPLVWISGDTKTHAEQIEAAGGKWSVKRSAYYFKVA